MPEHFQVWLMDMSGYFQDGDCWSASNFRLAMALGCLRLNRVVVAVGRKYQFIFSMLVTDGHDLVLPGWSCFVAVFQVVPASFQDAVHWWPLALFPG